MKILLDSCIWSGAKKTIEASGYDCKWIGDFLKDPGDEAIMHLAVHEERIIVTLDKDFGELAVFKGTAHAGIVRLVDFSATRHGEITLFVLKNYADDLLKKSIITIDPIKVRIRSWGY